MTTKHISWIFRAPLALPLCLLVATAAEAQVPTGPTNPGGSYSGNPQQGNTPDLQLGSSLHVAVQHAPHGNTIMLAALLTSNFGSVHNKAILIEVLEGTQTRLSKTLKTDAKGRVTTPFVIPQVGAPVKYTVRASFAGDDALASASDTESMPVEAGGPLGYLDPGGVRMTGYETKVAANLANTLRVHFDSAAGTNGQVRFFLQQKELGTAVVDGTGMARLQWTPTAAQLSYMAETGQGQRRASMVAWFEPNSASSKPVAAAIFPIHAWPGNNACDRTNYGSDCYPGIAEDTQIKDVRRARVRVYRKDPTRGTHRTQAKLDLRFKVPPRPPKKEICREDRIPKSVKGTCERTCEYVELVSFDAAGNASHVARDQDAKGCDRYQEIQLPIAEREVQLAHDLCRLVAARDKKTTWNFNLESSFSGHVAGLFFHRDPIVWSTGNGWMARIDTDIFSRETDVPFPIDIECRE